MENSNPLGHAVGSSPIIWDHAGSVWMGDPIRNELTKWKNSMMSQIPIPEAVHQAPAQSIGLDRDGSLLVSFKPNGLWRFDGSWNQVRDPQLPQDEPLSIVRDKQKHVWLGYTNSLIVEHSEDGYHVFSSKNNGNLGNVLTFGFTNDRLWAAGTNGLAYLDGNTFRRIALARGSSLTGVSGVTQDKLGNLWLNTSTGVIRIPGWAIS